MKILLSPAKSLDLGTSIPSKPYSTPVLMESAYKVAEILKQQDPKGLQSLMSISPKLATLNHERHQALSKHLDLNNAKLCIYTFSGDVYKGLDASSIDAKHDDRLNQTVRILSGLYGVLKPFDLIQPYRLEMGTKLNIETQPNLYAYWSEQVTDTLNQEEPNLIINLASEEYFKVVDQTKLKAKVVTPVFKEQRQGQLKVIGLLAKQARGLMTRFIIKHNSQTIEDLKSFNLKGYQFSPSHATETVLTFIA